jgi:glycosyltransferase involved in cell wall biosynthesis
MHNLLLLSYAFQPDNTPAAARPNQLYRFLPEFNVRPVVFASSYEGSSNDDQDVYRVPYKTHSAGTMLASSLAGWFMRFLAPYNDRWPWVPHAVSAAAQYIETHSVDAIYSTSPFLASHFAAMWLKRAFGLPWIADFQDPICDNPFRTRRWIFPYDKIIERLIFGSADRIIANTDTIERVWRERYPQWAHKMSVLWNSFDPDEHVVSLPGVAKHRRTIAHIGSLYGGRHPAQLLHSLKRLKIEPDDICVKLVGPIDEGVYSSYGGLLEEMRDLGLLQFRNGLVPREDALRETAEADYLLLLDVNEKNVAFQVPSKLLDYIRIGKPILAYTPKGSPVESILARSGIAYLSIAPDEPEAIADSKLAEFLKLPLETRVPSTWFTENFSAVSLARTVAEMVDSALAESRKSDVGKRSTSRSGSVERPAAISIRTAPLQQLVAEAEADVNPERPCVVTTADAEEEFEWSKPLSRSFCEVKAMNSQYLLHRVFDRYKVIPTYLVTYPIVTQDDGAAFLQDCLKDGKCEIGTQLHPWVTPPFDEEINDFNSFAGNLPASLEFDKLRVLTDAISERFGVRPSTYRAGRYGIGPNTVKSLAALGYQVDSSVAPEFSYSGSGGPVFFGRSVKPYWLDSERRLLEIPLTSTYIGRLVGSSWRGLANELFRNDHRHIVAKSLMARSRLIERIRLTPEGTSVSDGKRLVRALLKRGTRIFIVSYHTPSLVPGNTPYVRSMADRERFLNWFDEFYAFFLEEIGGQAATPSDIYNLARKRISGEKNRERTQPAA